MVTNMFKQEKLLPSLLMNRWGRKAVDIFLLVKPWDRTIPPKTRNAHLILPDDSTKHNYIMSDLFKRSGRWKNSLP